MSSDSSKFIEITRVINPLLFWFKYKAAENAGIEHIERAITTYVTELSASNSELPTAQNTGDKYRDEKYVTVYMKSKEKWIRAEIDDATVDEQNELIVWAIDYGVPLKKSLDTIVLLSAELKDLCRMTQPAAIKGGIAGLNPASKRLTPVIVILYYRYLLSPSIIENETQHFISGKSSGVGKNKKMGKKLDWLHE